MHKTMQKCFPSYKKKMEKMCICVICLILHIIILFCSPTYRQNRQATFAKLKKIHMPSNILNKNK